VEEMKVKIAMAIVVLIILIGSLLGIRSIHLTNLSHSSNTALAFLDEEGFFVLYHSGDFGPYTLTEHTINEKPYSDYLAVQTEDPSFYLDKDIKHEFFYVANHPLSFLGIGITHVTVMMNNEEVVGAFSTKAGTVYPLHNEQ
jgi:hypothetical protein